MILNAPLAFVDVETTGMSANRERIIEIAIHKIFDSKLVESYESLVNPGKKIDPFITKLTNITNQDVAKAPRFDQISDQIYELLNGCVFVAHNVEFDYSFLATEFRKCGISFSPKKLCTVKLSRSLFPEHTHHSLDHIIARNDLKISNRHRAGDDAMILWKFYLKLFDQFDIGTIEKAFANQLR